MECKDIKESLDDFIEENIEESKKTQINAHLDKCESCRKEYEVLKTTIDALRGIKMLSPPDGMWQKIRERLPGKERKQSLIGYLPVLLPMVACLVILVFAGIMANNYRNQNVMNYRLKEAYSFMATGNYASALDICQNISPSPDFTAEVMLIKGKCFDGMGNTEEAMKIYEEITKKFPENISAAESYYLLGINYEKEHDLSRASEAYSKVMDNFSPEKLRFFEDMALRLKICETILAEQEKMLAVRGENSNETTHQEKLKKISDLIDKRLPKEDTLKLEEAEMFINKKEFQQSLEITEDILKKGTDKDTEIKALLLKGMSLYWLANFKEAEKCFKEIINNHPEESYYQACASYYLGEINVSKKNDKEALQNFQKSLPLLFPTSEKFLLQPK